MRLLRRVVKRQVKNSFVPKMPWNQKPPRRRPKRYG